MNVPNKNLIGRLHSTMTAKFVCSGRLWMVATISTLLMFISSLMLVLAPATWATGALAVSFLLGVTTLISRVFATRIYLEAEKIRRRHRLLISTGRCPFFNEQEIPSSNAKQNLGVVSENRKYYSFTTPPGPLRLAENFLEEVTYTAFLAPKTVLLIAVIIAVGLILSIMLLLLNEFGWKVHAVNLMTFLFTSSFVHQLVAFDRLGRCARDFGVCLPSLATKEFLVQDLMSALTDYDCSLARAGCPLPDWLYKKHRKELGARWRERHTQFLSATNVGNEDSEVSINEEPPASLIKFLYTHFLDSELRLLAKSISGWDISPHLPGCHASVIEISTALVEGLQRQKHIAESFFNLLRDERPALVGKIDLLSSRWFGKNALE